MKIKTKLILNMVIGAVAVWSIVITSIFGLTFIKGKLSYLTQKSTPYQMRTVEFQKELQGAITDLVKVSASINQKEYQKFKGDAEKSLASVKTAQSSLEEMANTKFETSDELSSVGKELFDVVAAKLSTEVAAFEANQKVSLRLKESSQRLKELDKRIRSLQTGKNSSFAAVLKDTGSFSNRLRSVEELRNLIKDMQIIVLEMRSAQKSTAVLIAKGKMNAVKNKIETNEYQKTHPAIANDSKEIITKIEEFAKLQSAALTQKTDEAKEKSATLGKDVAEKVNALFLTLEQEATLANEKFAIESGKQGTIFGQSNSANSILITNSELVSVGMSLEGLSTKLFTLESIAEIDKLLPEINSTFSKIDTLTKNLNQSLGKLGVKDEIKILNSVQLSLNGVKGELFSANGIVSTLKQHLDATEKAVKIGDKLRSIVVKQGEKGAETVTAAKGEQEKAIGEVNKMVKQSIFLLISIGSIAAIIGTFFGVWGFRSVINPLNSLVKVAESVADGNLHIRDINRSDDEFGQVQGAMDKMVHNLRDMVGKITDTTSTVASSSQELASTADELDRNSKVQSNGIDTTVTAMTEMVQTIQDVSGNAINTSDSAANMKKIAIAGKDALDATSKELFAFAEIVKQSAEKTEALGVKSEAINDIVEMIKDIADQTNLLALNASIEAARAGDMGRGFAVVADSVRQLAQRTIESSDQIATTVKDMHTEVDASVVVMKKERQAIETIIEHINNTVSSMGEIVNHVEEVFGMVQTIATATEEQSATAEDVNRTMVNINDVTKQLTTSVNEIKNTSENFARLAADLQQMVGWFKL